MVYAIIPAYNEAKKISEVVLAVQQVVDSVIVVDDASTDETTKRAVAAGAVALRHIVNRGQGAALETGHRYVRKQKDASYVVHFDGDGQFSSEDIPLALAAIKKAQVDILFGSRFLEKKGNIPMMKKYMVHPVGRLIEKCFGAVDRTDVHNGFRILSMQALEKINITQDRMAHATEIPQQVKKQKLSYIEFPVQVTYHEYGQSGFAGIKIIQDLLFKR